MPPKKKKEPTLTAKEQEALDELRKEEEEAQEGAARMQKEREEEVERRKPFEAHEKKIRKAVEECVGHLRVLKDRRLALEAHRRLLQRINENLVEKF